MRKPRTPPKQPTVWTCNLSMTLGSEKTNKAFAIDMTGHARDVIDQLVSAKVEVTEAVEQAVNSIISSAQGFGIRRDGK